MFPLAWSIPTHGLQSEATPALRKTPGSDLTHLKGPGSAARASREKVRVVPWGDEQGVVDVDTSGDHEEVRRRVPLQDASGVAARAGGPTKAGDACLREALFMAADHARKTDPTLAARYHRLMVHNGKHHTSALCTIAAVLLTRIAACLRNNTAY